MENLELLKTKIAEIATSESIDKDEREILELLLENNPEKYAELYFYIKTSETLGRIERQLRNLNNYISQNNAIPVTIV